MFLSKWSLDNSSTRYLVTSNSNWKTYLLFTHYLNIYIINYICLDKTLSFETFPTPSNSVYQPPQHRLAFSHCVRENDLRQPVSWRFPGKLPTVSWANRFPQPCSPICYLLYWITNHCYLRLLSLRGNLPSLRASIFSHSSPANFHPTESSSRCLANSRFYDVASTTLISIVESVSIFVSPVEHQPDGLIQ